MTKPRAVPFAELQRFLNELGFKERRSKSARVFNHAKEGLLVFRSYDDTEPVKEHDLVSTRKFLDLRGLLEGKDFDAFLQQTGTPA